MRLKKQTWSKQKATNSHKPILKIKKPVNTSKIEIVEHIYGPDCNLWIAKWRYKSPQDV